MGNPDMMPTRCQYPNDISKTNCTAVYQNWPRVPEAIDWFSIDQYDSCHTFVDGSLSNCSLRNELEPDTMRWYYESYVFPKLASHQSCWVVPGLFGDVNCHQYGVNGSVDLWNPLCKDFRGTDTELLELQDKMLVSKLRGYMAWIGQEERVTGMLPFTWDHHNNYINTTQAFLVMGASDFPGVMAELKAIARTIS